MKERDTNSTPLVSYTRGNDLSQSLEGAGGIGGLLARSDGYSSGNFTDNNYYHADGNGNITYLETSSQTLAASYRYDAFGNTLSSSGTLAGANTYRFSSKEFITNGSFYSYLYRFCSPSLQRWMNRDPFNEGGFQLLSLVSAVVGSQEEDNLYCFVRNNPGQHVDPLGLQTVFPLPVPPGANAQCAAICRKKGSIGGTAYGCIAFGLPGCYYWVCQCKCATMHKGPPPPD